jgi:hypothetical protein
MGDKILDFYLWILIDFPADFPAMHEIASWLKFFTGGVIPLLTLSSVPCPLVQ